VLKCHPPYRPGFRAEAVRLVREGGQSLDRLAKDLGCSGQVIRNWVGQANLDAGRRTDGLTIAERRASRPTRAYILLQATEMVQ
jgi:transposase-like protein